MHAQLLSQVQLFGTPWTTTCQAPLSMEFSRQEYGSGLPFIPPGGLPNPGMERTSPVSPALQADSLPMSRLGSPRVPSPSDVYSWNDTANGCLPRWMESSLMTEPRGCICSLFSLLCWVEHSALQIFVEERDDRQRD